MLDLHVQQDIELIDKRYAVQIAFHQVAYVTYVTWWKAICVCSTALQ